MTKPSDELLKRAYAQDASIYQETPQDVAFLPPQNRKSN